MTDERRGDQRRRTLFKGLIVFNERRSTVECMIRNMSATGAQLKVASIVGIPDTFDLLIDKETRVCKVARRQEGELGVAFVQPGYDGPLLSVELSAVPEGGYRWIAVIAIAQDGARPAGYRAEGTVAGASGPFGPFEMTVHDDKRPAWTPIPDSQSGDARSRIEALVLDAVGRAEAVNPPAPGAE